MKLLEKSDKEIQEIAQPIWDNLVKTSNIKDYGGFTKDFSSQMLYGANEVELGKQWANNKLLTSLSEKQEFLGCIRRAQFITVLYKQTSNTMPGEFLGRLVLGVEDEAVKSYTEYLELVESGKVENIAAPSLAISYYGLGSDAKLTDLIRCVRADEEHHSETNHNYADKL